MTYERQPVPDWVDMIAEREAEIARLRERLEIDPSHPYDGIYCRDETIRAQDAEIARLKAGGCARDQGLTQYCAEAAAKDAEITALKAEVERLRAALESVAGTTVSSWIADIHGDTQDEWRDKLDDAISTARAALTQEKTDEPHP